MVENEKKQAEEQRKIHIEEENIMRQKLIELKEEKGRHLEEENFRILEKERQRKHEEDKKSQLEEEKRRHIEKEQKRKVMEERRMEEQKIRKEEDERRAVQQQEEADCIALRLIAEQLVAAQSTASAAETSDDAVVYYQATATATSRSASRVEEVAPPIPPKVRGSALTPTPSHGRASPSSVADSGSFSDDTMTSQSTVRTGQFIRVREKVVMLERKLEEEALRLEEDEEDGGSGRTSRGGGIRPETIPGAVRLLPTPPNSRPSSQASSRKSSLSRSNSMDMTARPLFSPVAAARSQQQSPAFTRRHLDTPPPRYKPPEPDLLAQSIRVESRKISDTFSTTARMAETFSSSCSNTMKTTLCDESPPARPPPPKYGEVAYGEAHLAAGSVPERREEVETGRTDAREATRRSESSTGEDMEWRTSRRSTGVSGTLTSPPPLESVPLVLAARESIDREVR